MEVTEPEQPQEPPAAAIAAAAEHKNEEFAEDLGRLLGTARAKAEGWIGQRQTVTKHLEEIRDTAVELLRKLGGGNWSQADESSGAAGSVRPRQSVADAPEATGAPRKRTMSAAARKAISDAQKARWARQKRAKGLL